MALKKGFCTHCRGEERFRIFDVNKDAEVCYCPHCTHAMSPQEAIDNYNWMISSYLKKASKELFETTEYLSAYKTFAHVIDLDETIKVAYFGRLLSLVYISTLRNSKISHALLMHRQQARLFHYQETARGYFHFLWLLIDALDQYENKMKKRLSYRDVFYDSDCVVLYLKRMNEIKNYKDFLISEAEYFIDANKEQYKAVVNRIKNNYSQYIGAFKAKYVTADGSSYRFLDFAKNGNPNINLQSRAESDKVHHSKPVELYPKDNKKSGIRDDVYQNNLPMSRFVAASIPLAIFLSVVVAGGMITSLFLMEQNLKLMIYILAAILLSASLLLIILHFAWKRSLRKKYYNGTNPFTLK